MSFKATVSAGWTYTTGDTATASNLNALGIPDVTVPDNQTYLANVGSASTPGIAFHGDANTGLAQLSGADTISIVAGGASPVVFSSDQSAFSNGTDAKPAITFFGDADTGVNHNATNEVDIVCGGAVISTFTASGMDVVGKITATSMTIGGASVLTTGINVATVSVATDFLGSSTSWGTTSTLVGTGTVTAISPVGHSTSDASGRGMVTQSVSAVSDRAVVTIPFTCLPPTGFAKFRVTPSSPLSTPSQRYEVLVGMFNQLTTTSSSGSGAWFQYVDSASAQWQTVTYNGTTRETTTTAITYTLATPYTLEIRHTAQSSFQFYIDGVLVATHTAVTFTSTSDNFQYIGCGIEKLVGSSATVVLLDSIEGSTPLTRT